MLNEFSDSKLTTKAVRNYKGYRFPYAYSLMLYLSPDNTQHKLVWNSRDGYAHPTLPMLYGIPGVISYGVADNPIPDFVPPGDMNVWIDGYRGYPQLVTGAQYKAMKEEKDA